MLWSEAAYGIRSLCQDLLTPERYSAMDLITAVNNGLALSFRLRPDLFVGVLVVPSIDLIDVAEDSFVVPIDEAYAPGLVEHAAGWLMLRDDEYTTDGRAAALLASYRNALLGARPVA
jgi:hypothetical protein